MMRLIVVTFAALGWSFYVMSGGPDFEPRGTRDAQPVQVASVAEAAKKPEHVQPAQELVTNVAVRAPLVRQQPQPASQDPAVIAAVQENQTPITGLSAFANQGANFTLASLEDGAAGLRQAETEVLNDAPPAPEVFEVEKDIREISGTRVNLRDGPGTIYPIIGKTTIGQKVEVLGESGTGWLRLRVVSAQQVGWISASLVRKTAN